MTDGEEDPQRHLVLFDCNIYLDVACLVGIPFSWDKFDATAARIAKTRVPHPSDRAFDSLRAVAMCTSGRFAGSETLEVWTNAHIDKIVRGKASQSTTRDANGYCGLGWSASDAGSLVDKLIWGVVEGSNGGTLGEHFPHGNPPLDYEDGMVYGACRALVNEDPLAHVYCVTRDRGFIEAYKDGRLSDYATVLTPSNFVLLMRAARAQYSMRQMRP
jgi:hypothetical protein